MDGARQLGRTFSALAEPISRTFPTEPPSFCVGKTSIHYLVRHTGAGRDEELRLRGGSVCGVAANSPAGNADFRRTLETGCGARAAPRRQASVDTDRRLETGRRLPSVRRRHALRADKTRTHDSLRRAVACAGDDPANFHTIVANCMAHAHRATLSGSSIRPIVE